MEKDAEFVATEVIAGFPLVSIRRAIMHVGLMDDRDDIKLVSEALGCPLRQAEGVLEALEHRGFVAKAKKKRQWDSTSLGWRLKWDWKPPRRMQPVIERDDDSDAANQGFERVWCSVLRTDADDSHTFEEAQFDVSVFAEYESDRVVEISVVQPDDYDHPDDSATIETSVYLDVASAKKFAAGLQEAIEQAEAEIARRATAKPRKRRRTVEPRHEPRANHAGSSPSKDTAERSTSEAARARAAVKAEAAAEKKKEDRKKREKAALAATLAELRRPR